MTLSLFAAPALSFAAGATITTPTASSTSSPAAGGALPVDTSKLSILPTATDDLRTQRILNGLAVQAGWFPQIKITVKDGMVTIKGMAKNAQQVDWLSKTADRLPGVIAVINQAEIDTPPLTDLTPAKEEFKRLVGEAKKSLPLFAFALLNLLVFIVLGIYLHKLSKKLWGRHISNPFLLSTVSRLTMLPVWALFFYLTLKAAGLSALATTIIGGTGAAGIIIGFAFKGIAENYLSGLLLAIRSPFTKGDEIQVGDYSGFVQNLNMRGTTVLDYDGNLVLIPNAIVIQSVIRNKTVNSQIRGSFLITISYEDSLGQGIELIQNALTTTPEILQKPGPSAAVDKLSASGIDVNVTYWFDSKKTSGDRLKSSLIGRIKDELFARGFHIPDVAREIVFADSLKIHMLSSSEEAQESQIERQTQVQKKAKTELKQPVAGNVDKGAEDQDIKNLGENVSLLKKTNGSDLLKSG